MRSCQWCGSGPRGTYCSAECARSHLRARSRGLLPWDGTVSARGVEHFLVGFWERVGEALDAGEGEALAFLLTDAFDFWADTSDLPDPARARRALLARVRVTLAAPTPRPRRRRCQCGQDDPAKFWRGHRACNDCERGWRENAQRRRPARWPRRRRIRVVPRLDRLALAVGESGAYSL